MALFWFVLLILVVVLWKLARGPVHQLVYSDLVEQLDKHNVASATYYSLRIPRNLRGTFASRQDCIT
jgi:hypothetical protein